MTGFYNPEFGKNKEGQYYDAALAKDFLKKSRYANGAEVLLLSINSGVFPRQAEVIQAQLAKLGIKVNISLNDFPTFRKRWLEERQWDMTQGQWDADLDPDETLYPELHSTETWNAGRWNSPEFDRLVELAQVEADQKKRKQYYDDAVKVLVEEAPSAVNTSSTGHLPASVPLDVWVAWLFMVCFSGLFGTHRVESLMAVSFLIAWLPLKLRPIITGTRAWADFGK